MTAIRTATLADVPVLATLKAEVESLTYGHYGTGAEPGGSRAEFCSPEYVARLLDAGTVLMACDDSTVVGMVSVRREAVMFISALYCLRSGQGVGSSLMRAALDGIVDHQPLLIEVFEDNTGAMGYFTALGFAEHGKRPSVSFAGRSLVIMKSRAGAVRQALEGRR